MAVGGCASAEASKLDIDHALQPSHVAGLPTGCAA